MYLYDLNIIVFFFDSCYHGGYYERTLQALLRAVAVYATGGAEALKELNFERDGPVKLLTNKIFKNN